MGKSQAAVSETDSRRATYQDVLDVPPYKVAEVVDGTLYIFDRPAVAHTIAGSTLGRYIGTPFNDGHGGPGGWWILNEPQLHLDEDIVVPDLTGWRRERMPVPPDTAYITLTPDWVCEVLSPSTRKFDLGDKSAVYARAGVSHIWFVDPIARSLEARELRGTQWVKIATLHDDATVSLPPFEAISFSLSVLWTPRTVHKAPPGDLTVEPQPAQIAVSQ